MKLKRFAHKIESIAYPLLTIFVIALLTATSIVALGLALAIFLIHKTVVGLIIAVALCVGAWIVIKLLFETLTDEVDL